MDHHPAFRLDTPSSALTLRPSAEALRVAQAHRGLGTSAASVKVPERVRKEAKARVQRGGGDPWCSQLVLSESELQLGQYQGQTFKWLLSNDVGYAVALLASHREERECGDTSYLPLMANKDAPASYAQLFPEVVAAVGGHPATEGSGSVRSQDQRVVGYGVHSGMTYASLYEATSAECCSYVQWLKKQKVKPGSQMHTLQIYILDRDKEKKKASVAAPPLVKKSKVAAPPEMKATCSAASVEPSDEMQLQAAMEVDCMAGRSASAALPTPGAVPQDHSSGGDGVPLLSCTRPTSATPEKPEPQQPVSGAELLPQTWRQTLPEEQHDWLGRALFRRNAKGQTTLTTEQRLWWSPPGPQPFYTQPPASANVFFQRPFFLWLPYRMWAYKLACPNCWGKMTGAGLYRTVRRVLDRDGWFFMGTEYLEYCSCGKRIAAWAQDIVNQLAIAYQQQFPAVLTYKLSCHKSVIAQMREQTLCNSATRLCKSLLEEHSEAWMSQSMNYLSVLKKLGVRGTAAQLVTVPPMHPVPSVTWLLSVFVRDALSRLEETKARVTSIFGNILKMDSTKKITMKLAGAAVGTAAWVTNVGNEQGQVLMSVLTAAEGDGLLPMATGLMRRYREAAEAPPRVLYVDRDCCSLLGQTSVAAMFHEWDQLVVRLDVWHLMRLFARGVTTESHQLYGQFMARLSYAIFEWDGEDVARLEKAKRSEGKDAHIRLSAKELARHCRRRTRAVDKAERLIQELLDQFWDVHNDFGVLLFNHGRMEEIWSTQRRHLRCIQDPPGVELYTKTGEVTMGGVRLPVYRCARDSTSLESFHLYLSRFVPVTSARALNFQVYLLEGLVSWNENRARAAVEGDQKKTEQCYNTRLQHALCQLTQEVMDLILVENYTQPKEYTGELIGIEYLYSQTGAVLEDAGRDPDAPDGADEIEEEWAAEDEGFEEPRDIKFLEHHDELLRGGHQPAADATAASSQDDAGRVEAGLTKVEKLVIGPDGHGGYQHVTALAHALVELHHQAYVTQRQAAEITALWLKLSDRDKAPVSFPQRHQDRLLKDRFKSSRTTHTPGGDSVQRCALGKGAGAAQSPKASRLVEAVFLRLCQVNYEGRTLAGVRVNRWGVIMREYNVIRDVIASSPTIMDNTSIHLFQVNQRTLLQWHNERSKKVNRKFILSSVPGPSTLQTAAQSPPAPRSLMLQPVKPEQPLQLKAEDASGLAVTHRGPGAPELYNLVVAAVTSATSAVSSSTATSSASWTSTSAASTSSGPVVPRSTAWQRKIREEEQRRQWELGLLFKEPRKNLTQFLCRRCGQPKTKAFGHSRYGGEHFCSKADGCSVEEWLAEKRLDPQKKKPPS